MLLLNPDDPLEVQNQKLLRITQSLMRRVEQKNEQSGLAYAQFERAAMLDAQVRERTNDLERTLDLLQESNARLEEANLATEAARTNLSEAIETISEGFALFGPDDRLILSNSRFCLNLRDVSEKLAEGMPFADYVALVSNSRYLALPEGDSPARWSKRRMERHGDNHVVFNVSLIWDRWLQVSEHRTARGGTVILQTDVTEIFRAERQERDKLRSEQAQIFRATLDHLNQGVCIFDSNQRLVGWNKKMNSLLDLPAEETALGRDFSFLLQSIGDQIEFAQGFDRLMLLRWAQSGRGRRPVAFEINKGEAKILSVFGQEMPDGGFVVSLTDVTAERQAAAALFDMNEKLERRVEERTTELGIALEEAERANASKSRFVAAASHDLLQPLSAAKLFVSSLGERAGDAETAAIAEKAETALSSAESIIGALLDISKLDAGKAVFDIQSVRLSAILGPLRDELTPMAERKGITLRVLNSDLVVESDPGYLRRILQNLVTNAIRYTDRGKVLVGTRRNGGSARVEVWDTGRGIPSADQATIFQEFKQLAPKDAADGLGLGLAIVERACKGLGHPLSLWSEPDVGSCFSLNAPICDEPQPIVGLGGRANPIDALPEAGHLVLLVENDLQVANAMSLMIEGWGISVIHAASSQEALSLLSEIDLTPDAMLLDYQLGDGVTGAELYRIITGQLGPVPTRIVSADRNKAMRQTCAALGLEIIHKPIDRNKLAAFLATLPTDTIQGPPCSLV
ncbi:MAG: PAS-domain containing protein [Pseudomonadota bacterium]